MTELGPNPLAIGEDDISVDDARRAIEATLVPLHESERVPLLRAIGRVLAIDLISPIDVPAHDNSAMDGYAFDGAVLHAGSGVTLDCVGTVLAGDAPGREVASGECVRIMTGAVLPRGVDTVVPLELCTVDDAVVVIAPGVVDAGEHRRRRGEDIARGGVALRTGRVLRPADIGVAASLGFVDLPVIRRLRVAVFSTGNEVTAPGTPLPDNCIYDSNRFALLAAVERLGMEAIDLGLLRDDPATLRDTLRSAMSCADAVVTSGGVSGGDADHIRTVIAELGEVDFWKVAMRPGRSFAFGMLRGERPTWLFALPGNPVAALVTFYVFARDALLTLAGATPEPIPRLQARSVAGIRKRPGRTEFQRGRVEQGADGRWDVRSVGPQGAGILRSMSEANALIVLPHDCRSVPAGEWVEVWLFDGLA